jgi:hypothetical protein
MVMANADVRRAAADVTCTTHPLYLTQSPSRLRVKTEIDDRRWLCPV